MAWGYDDWLTDRNARGTWMRTTALSRLAEQILRTPATAEEGLGCLLDEVLGDVGIELPRMPKAYVDADTERAEAWLRAGLASARDAGVEFAAIAFVLTDGAPYAIEIALVDKPVHTDEEWGDGIVWRHEPRLGFSLLDEVLPALGSWPKETQRDADYILPLAYSAFVMRDLLRSGELPPPIPTNAAIVSYCGGDHLLIPSRRSASESPVAAIEASPP